jgi:uncharacterized membrane protein
MAIGLELSKPFALEASFAQFRQLRIGSGIAMALLAMVSIAYSLSAELSLMAQSRADLAAERQAGAKQATSADKHRARTEAELAALGTVRPTAAVKADLDALLANPRLNSCDGWLANVRLRAVCIETVAPLRSELAKADRRDALEGELRGLGTVLVARPADAGADSLATYAAALGLSIQPKALGDLLVLVGVLALEMGSALSVLLVRSVALDKPKPTVQTSWTAALQEHRPALPAPAADDVPLKVLDSPVLDNTEAAVRAPQLSKRRGLGSFGRKRQQDIEAAVLDRLKASGGQLSDASVRGLASMVGAPKSTVHLALGALVASGLVAKVGEALVLRS